MLFLWQFECQSLECPAVGLLCVIQRLMFSCKHCGGKVNVLFAEQLSLLKHIPPFPPFFTITISLFAVYPSISKFSLSSHAIFSIWLTPICSFPLPHCSLPSTRSFPSLLSPLSHPFFPILPAPLPCLSLLRIDLLSLHWWPWWFSWMVHSLSSASPWPSFATCSYSSTQRFFLCGHNDSTSPAAQPRDPSIII